jgi:hypothetical protein
VALTQPRRLLFPYISHLVISLGLDPDRDHLRFSCDFLLACIISMGPLMDCFSSTPWPDMLFW